ncbi:acyl-CoA N-acyltransferase [Thozetella sp. PMI_491]|nr:acyl-CoA N-acyltransferase [Thozetella sp. PMI_491]
MSTPSFLYEQRRLENDLVALELFDRNLHVARLVKEIKENPDMVRFLSFPPISSEEDLVEQVVGHVDASPEECLYAILDKTNSPGGETKSDNYAGIMVLSATSQVHAITEMGIIVFPAFQRTHVSTNASGLLLQWALDPPSAGGLGLRRVEWRTHSENEASRRLASRMGFEFEGIMRWQRICHGGKVGLAIDALERRNGTTGEGIGRHTALYSIVWDEWDTKRPQVVAKMSRA